jgi:hypothetical protein
VHLTGVGHRPRLLGVLTELHHGPVVMQPAAELLVDGCLRPGMQRLPGRREARADLGRVLRQVGQNGGGRPLAQQLDPR